MSVTESQQATVTYYLKMFFWSIYDMFRRVKKLPHEPIIIDPKEVRIWVIGHATTLINFYGTTILTDPVLVNALPFPKRLVASGYTADELPPIDVVVVSHAHFDHCDTRSLKKISKKSNTIVVPRECADIVKGMSFGRVVELDWENSMTISGVRIVAYKPEHWGKRWPWEFRRRGYNCYVFEKDGRAVFFGGDTGYGEFFKLIGQKHRIDVALLPIGAYEPFTPHHMNPKEAHQAFADLGSAHCIPIHWGSFRLALEPMDEPPELFIQHAHERGVADRAHVLLNGTSFALILASEVSRAAASFNH